MGLRSFRDLAALNAVGANLHALRTPLGKLDANRLQIWIEPAGRPIVSVGYVVTKLWAFPTNFAAFSHYFMKPPGSNPTRISDT